jgi:parallel beta-helix repeat protein
MMNWTIEPQKVKMNKAVSAVFTLILLICIICLSELSFPVKASGTIFIRVDGSVEPDTAPISTIDNVTYIFTDNIYDEIAVERDNIVIDGKGYTVQGTGSGTGIYLSGRSNVTVKNMEIRAFERGIRLDNSSNSTLSANNVTDNEYGIVLYYSSSENKLRHNDASENRYNLGIHTASASGYIQDIDDSNTVSGKPVYYWINKRDMTVPLDAGYVVLVNCTRITVKNLSLANNMQGVALSFTTNSTITNNNLTNNFDGIRVDHSSNNNMISENNITGSTHYGIRFFYDPLANPIYRNNVINKEYGSQIDGPPCNNTICRNNITNNEDGIRLDYPSNNTICNNNVANNSYGIGLYGSSSNNTVSENNIANNHYGIWFHRSYSSWIYHNNFIDNALHVYPTFYLNSWNASYPSGGNYWSIYEGTDLYRGHDQDEAGSDGIGDAPYVQDYYPLMKPYGGLYDVGVTETIPSKTAVGQNYSLNTTVKILNYGVNTETFNVTVRFNTTILQTGTITLTSRNSTAITFTWNTIGWTKGNYTITTHVTPIPGETCTSDNTYLYGFVAVTIPGDVDGNYHVDIYDVVKTCTYYGTQEGDPEYEANCDIDGDGDVDIYDIAVMCNHYGESW